MTREKRCARCASKPAHGGLVKQLLTLSRIEAAPTLAMNDKIDVPMMLRVVEQAQTLSQQKQTSTSTSMRQLVLLAAKSSCEARCPIWCITRLTIRQRDGDYRQLATGAAWRVVQRRG